MTAAIAGGGIPPGGPGLVGLDGGFQKVEAPLTAAPGDVERFRAAMDRSGTPEVQETQPVNTVPDAGATQSVQDAHRATGGDRILDSMDRMRGVDLSSDVQRAMVEAQKILGQKNIGPADLLRYQGALMSMGMKTGALASAERNTTQGLEKVLQAQ